RIRQGGQCADRCRRDGVLRIAPILLKHEEWGEPILTQVQLAARQIVFYSHPCYRHHPRRAPTVIRGFAVEVSPAVDAIPFVRFFGWRSCRCFRLNRVTISCLAAIYPIWLYG